jgi:hypothetical protein
MDKLELPNLNLLIEALSLYDFEDESYIINLAKGKYDLENGEESN